MQSNKTVVLGEASESDSEEISLNDEIQVDVRDEELDSSHDSEAPPTPANDLTNKQVEPPTTKKPTAETRRGFASAWIPSLGATASLAKLVSYKSYSLLTTGGQAAPPRAPEAPLDPRQEAISNLPILHKTLYLKNQQLHACLDHALKHPYVKASRDLNTISQRLVGVQRTIQEVEIGVANIKRERSNLDIKINSIM